jgi:hypothetical protein
MKATFNERFAMKTILDYDPKTDEFLPKPVSIISLLYEYSHCYKFIKVKLKVNNRS